MKIRSINRKDIRYKILMISANSLAVLLFLYLYIWNDFESKELNPIFGFIYLIIVFVCNIIGKVITDFIPIIYVIILIIYYYI